MLSVIRILIRRWYSGLTAGVRHLIRSIFQRAEVESDLDAELALHLELETEQRIREGLDPVAARRAALLAFGGLEKYKEGTRDVRRLRLLEDCVADIRYALRGLRRSPGFAIVVILTLSLGIGANAGLFGLLNALVLRPPAGVPSTAGLVRIGNGDARMGLFAAVSHPDFRELVEGAAGVIDLAGSMNTAGMALGSAGGTIRVPGQLVSANYFSVLGVEPRHGRAFLPEEDREDGPAVVVIGHDLWEREFGGDPGVLGRSILINGHGFTVVGVAPPGFTGLEIGEPASLWAPLAAQPLVQPRSYDPLRDRGRAEIQMIGRLGEGQTIDRAQGVLGLVAKRVEAASPEGRGRPLRPLVTPLRGWVDMRLLGEEAPLIGLAWVLTGLLLLVICSNLANLLLARALSRRREIGIRLALGAGRGRLFRLLLAEALTLTLSAGLLGLLLAYWAALWFQARFRGPLAPLEVAPDLLTVTFTLGLAVLIGIAFGLLPARRASRPEVVTALKGDDGGGIRHSRLQASLVIAQISLSLVLLTAGGIFLRRVQASGDARLGFDTEQVLLATLDLSTRGYSKGRREEFYTELRERAARLPGVEAVTVPAAVPQVGPVGAERISLAAASLDQDLAPGTPGNHYAAQLPIAPDYFGTLRIPILRGRPLEARDLGATQQVAVIGEGLARRLFPGEDPVGQTIYFERRNAEHIPVEVIGVAADVVWGELAAEPRPHLYSPYTRSFEPFETTLALRATGDPVLIAPLIRGLIRELDPDLPVYDLRTLDDVVAAKLRTQRELTGLIASFSTLALILAGIGLYGLIALTVEGRTREIGVRIALGGGERQVVHHLVAAGARLLTLGLLIGAPLTLAVGRLISATLPGTRATDPRTLALAGLCISVVSLLAIYLPARRAARVDPMIALRRE